jgi:hypothetical protein
MMMMIRSFHDPPRWPAPHFADRPTFVEQTADESVVTLLGGAARLL